MKIKINKRRMWLFLKWSNKPKWNKMSKKNIRVHFVLANYSWTWISHEILLIYPIRSQWRKAIFSLLIGIIGDSFLIVPCPYPPLSNGALTSEDSTFWTGTCQALWCYQSLHEFISWSPVMILSPVMSRRVFPWSHSSPSGFSNFLHLLIFFCKAPWGLRWELWWGHPI